MFDLTQIAAEFIRNNPAEGMGVMALGLMAVCWFAKEWI